MIEFDPGFENNAFSRTAKRPLVVTYKDHPHEARSSSFEILIIRVKFSHVVSLPNSTISFLLFSNKAVRCKRRH